MQTLSTVNKISLPLHRHGEIEDSFDLFIMKVLLSAGSWKLGEEKVNLFEPIQELWYCEAVILLNAKKVRLLIFHRHRFRDVDLA